MSVKVFISWSGESSQKIGSALRSWLPSALQYVRPYYTPEDIEKGTKWSSEITRELAESNVGLICLTRDNTEKPWILFEAGALSKSIESSRVCTLLFGLEPTDVKGPLTSFQSTKFVKGDFKRLVDTINESAGEARLADSVLDSVFEMWWPTLEQEIKSILDTSSKSASKVTRTERDLLEEILELARLTNSARSRSARVSPAAMRDVVEIMQELQFALRTRDIDLAIQLFSKLQRPLKHIARESGNLDYFERLHRLRERSEFLEAMLVKHTQDAGISADAGEESEQ